LDTKEDVLTLVDPSIAIEVAWFKVMSGSGAKKLLQAAVYKVLPSGPSDTNAADKALALDLLKDTAPYVFSDAESQSAVNIAAEWVKSISMMRRPAVEAAKDNDFLKGVRERLQYFVVVEIAGNSDGSNALTLSGAAALSHKYSRVEERFTNGEDVLVEELRIFTTFGWLMTDSQSTVHRTWVERCFKKAGSAGSSGALAKAGGSASSSSGKAALKKSKLAIDSTKNLRDATLSLFKKKRKH
jgi:hypothetical protein